MTETTRSSVRRDLRGRTRILLAGVLLVFTVAGGVAAKHIAPPGPEGGASGGGPVPMHFSAAGGGPIHFDGQIDRGSLLMGGDGIVKLELTMSADRTGAIRRVPTDLVVVLDRSGSMQGDPLLHATAAVRELISQLGSEDRFALVTYASGAEIAIPLSAATGSAREDWSARIARIHANGGTNMASGLDLAAHTVDSWRSAERTPRVILLSDGHANQGDHSKSGLRSRAARAVAGEYVLSTVGVGLGFDEETMAMLADAGTGNFYFVERTHDIASVFAGEFGAARDTVASALRVEIAPAPGVEVLDAAGYPLERANGVVSFRPGALFAGQERRVWLTLRAHADELEERDLAAVSLHFRHDGRDRVLRFDQTPRIAWVAGEDEYYAAMDDDARARGVLADEIGKLKQQVSRAVQKGEREPALKSIRDYVSQGRSLNQRLQRKDVADELDSLEELSIEVKEAFAASPARQNALGKKLSAEGLDERRVGAKK